MTAPLIARAAAHVGALRRRWFDQALILTYAGATGLVVVGFTLLSEAASHGFASLSRWGPFGPYLPLLWTPVLAVVLLKWTLMYAPAATGSGIPQVVRALHDDLSPTQQSWLVSLKVSLHKIVLVSGGLLAGLSIGREGPTVQVGAGVMVHARRWLSPSSGIDAHDLMVAGAAAGIAAAFNTPLGGIVFALEQLSRRRGMSHSALVISSIVLAGLVAVSVFGNETYFGRLRVQSLSWSLLGPGLLVAVSAGVAGGMFSRMVVASVRGLPGRLAVGEIGTRCALLPFARWQSRSWASSPAAPPPALAMRPRAPCSKGMRTTCRASTPCSSSARPGCRHGPACLRACSHRPWRSAPGSAMTSPC
jgi:H+/Cl- antiporter ClcA